MKRSFYRLFLSLLTAFLPACAFAQKPNRAIDSLLSVLTTEESDTSRIRSLNTLSRELSNAGNNDEAMKYANRALELATKILQLEKNTIAGNNHAAIRGAGIAFFNLGLIGYRKNDLRSALNNYLAALDYLERAGEKKLLAGLYSELGRSHGWLKGGDSSEAIKYFLAAIKVYNEIPDKTAASRIYFLMGNFYRNNLAYTKSKTSYQNSLAISEEIGDKPGIASCHCNLASIFSIMAQYPEALKHGLACLKMAEKLGDKKLIAHANSSIGNIRGNEENYEEAINSHLVSLNLYKELGLKSDIARTYMNLGGMHYEQGKYAEGLVYANNALRIFQELNNVYYRAMCLNSIGYCHFKIKEYVAAIQDFQASINISREEGYENLLGYANTYLGFTLSSQASADNRPPGDQKYKEAIQYLDRGMAFARSIEDREVLVVAYEALSFTFKAMNDFKRAFEFLNLYFELKDSLMNARIKLRQEKLRTEYEVERAVENDRARQEKATEIEKLKYEFTLAEERKEKERELLRQSLLNENRLNLENARHQQVLLHQKTTQEKKEADEKLKQDKKEAAMIEQREKEKADQKRKTELLMLGAGMLIVILVLGFLYFRQKMLKQKALERVETVHKMAELELQSLRAQLNPHFMFNSLNAIQDLILKEDNRSSHRYLSRFSKLLRMLLDNANQPFIPLKKELDFLELYLSLENLRIPDLHYSISTEPGIDAETTLIPNMMMQPYIENAIWHGLSHKTSDKKLDVHIHRSNGSLQCDIADNGVGRTKAEELKSLYRREHKSKGMELLSKRFSLLSKEYGTDIQTRVTDLVSNGNAAGTLVEITVPLAYSQKIKEHYHDTNHNN